MAEPKIAMRDLVGPYKGQVRFYIKHAAEHAVASGFAEYVRDEEPEAEAVIPARVEVGAPLVPEADPTPRARRKRS